MCLFGTGSEASCSLGVLHLFRGASEVAEAGTGSYGEEQTWIHLFNLTLCDDDEVMLNVLRCQLTY